MIVFMSLTSWFVCEPDGKVQAHARGSARCKNLSSSLMRRNLLCYTFNQTNLVFRKGHDDATNKIIIIYTLATTDTSCFSL